MKEFIAFIEVKNKYEYVAKAKKRGFNVVVFEKDVDDKIINLADVVIKCDTRDYNETIMRILEFSAKNKIIGVIPLHEQSVELTAIAAKILGVYGLNIKAAVLCRNKFLTRLFLKKAGIVIPNFSLCSDLNNLENTIVNTKINLPVIIKPLNFSGSSGVIKINDFGEITQKIKVALEERSRSSCKDSMVDTMEKYWLVEEYIDGFEVSVQTVSINGKTKIIAIHDKVIKMDEDFSERFVLTPSWRINAELQNKINDYCLKVLEALQFDFGISHLELRITDGEPILIEANARLGGGMTNEIVKASTQIDLFSLLLNMCIGKQQQIDIKQRKYIAVERIHAAKGVITQIKGLDNTVLHNEVLQLKQWKQVGDVIRTPSRDVIGAVMVEGITAKDALDKLDKYRENICVQTENK